MKQGAKISADVPKCVVKKNIKKDDKRYEDMWMEGELICEVKARLGKEQYMEAVQEGDYIEQGRMCYRKRERRAGVQKALTSTDEVKKKEAVDAKMFVSVSAKLANECSNWCKFALTGA